MGYQSGVSYIANEDNLFNRALSYQYQTMVKHANKYTRRSYNKFHLLTREETLDLNGNRLREHRFEYAASGESIYKRLPASYSLPIQKITQYYTLGSSKSRRVSTQRTYDDYGNTTKWADAPP
ncbi:hypothetical protein AB835_09245 [Candidatus Endobugula sertula]|uniref:Uncharacterized protein n=1 Tax=Candidatus Endobugula sertula TaxID=62101 RepID=A0A1D2QP21_9GAMM|nr:hypothetical protein AB835_09245 [Candidatus Endobugula sertula]